MSTSNGEAKTDTDIPSLAEKLRNAQRELAKARFKSVLSIAVDAIVDSDRGLPFDGLPEIIGTLKTKLGDADGTERERARGDDLVVLLLKYGDHSGECLIDAQPPECTCGWSDLYETLAEQDALRQAVEDAAAGADAKPGEPAAEAEPTRAHPMPAAPSAAEAAGGLAHDDDDDDHGLPAV